MNESNSLSLFFSLPLLVILSLYIISLSLSHSLIHSYLSFSLSLHIFLPYFPLSPSLFLISPIPLSLLLYYQNIKFFWSYLHASLHMHHYIVCFPPSESFLVLTKKLANAFRRKKHVYNAPSLKFSMALTQSATDKSQMKRWIKLMMADSKHV